MLQLCVELGDITQLKVDAIVNAANSQLAGGGGVDGAIHRAAGYEQLQTACRALGGCPTGEVRVTPGFKLPARYIFHAVGPVWHGGKHNEAALLASCYRNAILEAGKRGLASIAFPAISCGIYRFPPVEAVAIAVKQVRAATEQARSLKKIIFCCFSEDMAELYRRHLAEIDRSQGDAVDS